MRYRRIYLTPSAPRWRRENERAFVFGPRAENAAAAARCPIAALPFTGEELGAALGKGAVSALAITDIHFAHAFAEKLSGERPGFEDIRAALAEKDEKAMERQEEEKRHRRNLQKGKKKK